MSRIRARWLLPAVFALPLIAAQAAAAFPAGEQVNRGTGVAGAGAFTGTLSMPRLITDDGRLSLFDHVVQGAAFATQSPAEKASSGVYVRDVLQNVTLQLVSGNAHATGLTLDQKTLSVVTADRLSAADTDATDDLYLVDTATRVATLANTAPSTGAVNGAVTADGKAIVWSDAAGTYRSVLAGGAPEKLSTAPLAVSPYGLGTGLLNRTLMSGDGRAVSVLTGSVNAIARAGRPPLAIPGSGFVAERAARISLDGRVAIANLGYPSVLATIDIAGGTARTLAITPAFKEFQDPVQSVSADGTSALVEGNDGVWNVNLAAGTRARIVTTPNPSFTGIVLSANRRYLLANAAWTGYLTSDRGQLLAYPIGTAALPGGTDAPSPFAYLTFSPGCDKFTGFIPPTLPSLQFGAAPGTAIAGLPVPVSASITFRNSSGAVVKSGTLVPYGYVFNLPVGWTGRWTLDAAVTLTGGQVVRERWTQGSYGGTPDCADSDG